jgi:hypothetical protein
MPLIEFACSQGHVTEELFRGKDVVADTVVCACGGEAKRQLPRIARTPGRWGDSAAVWNEGLGCMVNGAKDIDRICNERGLVPLADLPRDHMDTTRHAQLERDKFSDRCVEAMQTTDILDVNTHSALDEVVP